MLFVFVSGCPDCRFVIVVIAVVVADVVVVGCSLFAFRSWLLVDG